MFSDSVFSFPQFVFSTVSLSHMFLCHTWVSLACSCNLPPPSLSNTNISRSHIMLHRVLYPSSCAVWHWAIRILKCMAANGRLQIQSTNTFLTHTNIKPVEMSVHTSVCVFVYIRECDQRLKVMPHNLIIKKKHTKTITHTQKKKNYLPMAPKEASCVTVQWLGQGQWYTSFI